MASVNEFLLVALGGAVGALGRYVVGTGLRTTVATTLTVNVAGSFALGVVVATTASEPLLLALGAGVCGAFTTFSSFAVELVRLFEEGRERTAVAYGLGMAVAAVAAVIAGGLLGTALA